MNNFLKILSDHKIDLFGSLNEVMSTIRKGVLYGLITYLIFKILG